MPALSVAMNDGCRSPTAKRSSSPRRLASRSASGAAAASVTRAKSHESPTRSVSSKTSASTEVRGGRKPGRGRRASLTQGSADPTRSVSQRTSTSGATEAESKSADRKKVNRPGTVSPFLRSTHHDLKHQISTLQGHIKFVQELAMKSDAKKVDLLFQMIDRDGNGTVDAEELATAMRRNDELSFSDSIEKAIDMCATFDVNGDGELDIAEFRIYVTSMVKELKVELSDFAEFLIVQLLLSRASPEEKRAGDIARVNINEEVIKREELFAALSNDCLREAFHMLDEASLGKVPFQKVSKVLLQTATKERRDVLSVLLGTDLSDTGALDFEEFGRLIVSVSNATSKSVDDTLDDLMNALDSQNSKDGDHRRFGENNEPIDANTYGRLKKLFELWDVNGDGDISMTELAEGLRKFQTVSGINADADALATALVAFDRDGYNQLDPGEFAQAMILYTKQFGVELHSLIDFMCLTSKTSSVHTTTSNLTCTSNNSSSSNKNTIFFAQEDQWGNEPSFEVDFWE